MSQVINVKSTVTQAEGFSVEVEDSTLLSTRYFPNGAGDNFVGKEVLFDFDSSDLEKGAFMTTQYQNGNTVNWIANSVIPPRVANSDTVDPKNLDRQMFERLCRAQGADLNRAQAFQDLLVLKAARLAKRTDRAIELLSALVLSEGKIEFDQPKDASDSAQTDHIQCKYYDPSKGCNNHFPVKIAWSSSSAKPYEDVCNMVNEGIKYGRRYTDLLLGANAWAALSKDETFRKFAGATYHSEGMMIDFGDIDSAQHVARSVFNGIQLNVIVYSGAYKSADGTMKQFIDPNAAILISEGIGRLLCGGCTLLADNVSYDLNTSFVDVMGKHCMSIYKDFNAQELQLREESRPLPAPRLSVNEMPWIYCDTSIADVGVNAGLYELYNGVSFTKDESITFTTEPSIQSSVKLIASNKTLGSNVITRGASASGTASWYAIRDGKKAEKINFADNGSILNFPVDLDRDITGKAMIYVTVE